MAYNPDEIAKVKHINEFARQLNIKLDGGTGDKLVPLTSFSAQFWLESASANRWQELINVTEPVQIDLRTWSSAAMGFNLVAGLGNVTLAETQRSKPYLKDISSTGTASWSVTNTYNRASERFSYVIQLQGPAKEECDLTFTLCIDESYSFQGFQKTFTFHIFNGEA